MVLLRYVNRDGDRQVTLHETAGSYDLCDEPAGEGRRPGVYFFLGGYESRAEADRVAGRHVALAMEFGTYEARAVTVGLCHEDVFRSEGGARRSSTA